ncbi:ABC transporter ATP-binding protein [Antrihabitans cavernicola]|uniref:ABC transporter ATP-binding protein n=1 Tax=Antrihabitans cavernicola TaxID=2495913 RepID=A0A5A7SEP3_9NOCA|nr:ABC transporter ATP-binding protein [Spelaeibacter cavernicola]KAA0023005.1 ABC transporter ATP-binding protein [Spelaeibacter cavernicola]
MTRTAPSHAPAIELRELRKTFTTRSGPAVRAVDGVDLTVQPGEIVAFLGPNGAGKTSTIDTMLGLAKPDHGSVELFGGDPASAVASGRVSAVMQSGGLLKDVTVEETVRLVAALFASPRPVSEVLARAGIADIGGRFVGKCSGGQQQRLRFALALLPNPDLIVLDEPTTGMDVEGRREFWNAMREDSSRGRTVLFATHYLDEADAYADRIVLVSKGRIVADGSAAQIKNLASGRVVRATWRDADQAKLMRIPGVDEVELRGDRVMVRAKDSDAVARYLLNFTDAVDLEIVSHNLEDAFLTLTTDAATADDTDFVRTGA